MPNIVFIIPQIFNTTLGIFSKLGILFGYSPVLAGAYSVI